MPVTKTEKPLPKLQPNPFQHEILELASKQRSNLKKVEVLQEYRNDALVTLMVMNFDESVISILPEGSVPYADVDGQTSLGGNLTDLINSKAKNNGLKTSGYFGTEEFAEEKNKTSLPCILAMNGIVVFFPGSLIVPFRVSIFAQTPFL